MRSIIATTDVPALARYYAADTIARFPLLTLTGTPSDNTVVDGVDILQVDGTRAPLVADIVALERAALGYPRRDEDLHWILERREGHVHRRGERTIAFAFVGADGAGPIAALERADLIPVLLHAESRARALGVSQLNLQVPGINGEVVRHLLARGFRIDSWVNLLMSNRPFGQFDPRGDPEKMSARRCRSPRARPCRWAPSSHSAAAGARARGRVACERWS